MGKKKIRGKEAPKRNRKKHAAGARNAPWPVVIVGVLILAWGAYAAWGYLAAPRGEATAQHWIPGGERRPTLQPALFTGAVARAYQVAREIPQVLDKLYCYCRCIEGHGHLSNLSCFADRHAAG